MRLTNACVCFLQSPLILDIQPRNGPMSGGSRVTILGQDLNTGGQLKAVLGDAPCIVDRSVGWCCGVCSVCCVALSSVALCCHYP